MPNIIHVWQLNGIPLNENNIPFEQLRVALGYTNQGKTEYVKEYVPQYGGVLGNINNVIFRDYSETKNTNVCFNIHNYMKQSNNDSNFEFKLEDLKGLNYELFSELFDKVDKSNFNKVNSLNDYIGPDFDIRVFNDVCIYLKNNFNKSSSKNS